MRQWTTAVKIFRSQDFSGNRGILGVGVPASAGPSIPFRFRLKAGLQQKRSEFEAGVPASAGPLNRQRCSPQWSVDPPGVEPGPPPRRGGALPLGHEPVGPLVIIPGNDNRSERISGPAGESNPGGTPLGSLLGASQVSSR